MHPAHAANDPFVCCNIIVSKQGEKLHQVMVLISLMRALREIA